MAHTGKIMRRIQCKNTLKKTHIKCIDFKIQENK